MSDYLEDAFRAAKEQFPAPHTVQISEGTKAIFTFVNAKLEIGDAQPRSFVLHEVRIHRQFVSDDPEQDEYEVGRYPRNHWGFCINHG